MTPIVITAPEIIQDEVNLWEALFLAGLQRLHVRKPHASVSQLKDMLISLPEKYHFRVILHQHHILTDDFKLGGIHFKSINQPEEFPIKDKNLSRSKSCHTPREILNNYKNYDYVFLSPIFDSISKKGYSSAFYTDEIKTFFQDNPLVKNCIALGGISARNTQECLDLGFAGCALLGSIWEGDDLTPNLISKRFRNNLSHTKPILENTNISSFQFITNDFSELDELEQIRQVCEAGANWIQLRLKNRSTEDIIQLGKHAAEICQHYQATFILNDHAHLVKEIGADGVHLGKADMSPIEARELLGVNYIIGGTANNMDDVHQLHKAGVDYIGLGPFRFTHTKKNLAPVLGLEGYKEILQACQNGNINTPIVAIGGIEVEDTTKLMEIGLNGIALSSSVTSAKNISNTTRNYLKQLINPLCKN
ncbi:thiamine phosphate synthase [Ancylomarina euxinus]|uniref:Thiamine-phosphate synthase n=1 Tax=Ancylomarina euxinus TaxID=2283627 RepID=A0A425XWY7_9BACT|nr:thiamine phosphate synthase [Ancylomarina euxinus]MCZ4696222.1 thiamine phosphate synthase [Ancylomarina euxinus]MUP16597.1 thiamine phosphate synthase [Ancylomarina euxinus]RRG19161.1 thiamine phosphate synthase [Ancylomarina euxinus]